MSDRHASWRTIAERNPSRRSTKAGASSSLRTPPFLTSCEMLSTGGGKRWTSTDAKAFSSARRISSRCTASGDAAPRFPPASRPKIDALTLAASSSSNVQSRKTTWRWPKTGPEPESATPSAARTMTPSWFRMRSFWSESFQLKMTQRDARSAGHTRRAS